MGAPCNGVVIRVDQAHSGSEGVSAPVDCDRDDANPRWIPVGAVGFFVIVIGLCGLMVVTARMTPPDPPIVPASPPPIELVPVQARRRITPGDLDA